MKLEKTITTTTTPRMVTKVETVTGKVFHVTPPLSVILTMENRENQQFKIPKGQKFNVDGQMVDAFALKKGMNVTATRITVTPETVVTQKAMLTGQMPPPTPPPAGVPILVTTAAPTLTPPTGEAALATGGAPAAPEASNTGRYLLIIGLVVVLILVAGLGLRAVRRTAEPELCGLGNDKAHAFVCKCSVEGQEGLRLPVTPINFGTAAGRFAIGRREYNSRSRALFPIRRTKLDASAEDRHGLGSIARGASGRAVRIARTEVLGRIRSTIRSSQPDARKPNSANKEGIRLA
jgi:hypothetical protein